MARPGPSQSTNQHLGYLEGGSMLSGEGGSMLNGEGGSMLSGEEQCLHVCCDGMM